MPGLARRLECGVMTIYGYVANKEELLGALAQRGLADLHLPAPLPTDPAETLIAWGRALRLTVLEHPSLPAIFLSRVVIGPAILRGIEALLTALARGEVRPADGIRAIYAVLVYTTGFVAWELPRTHQQPQQAYTAAWLHAVSTLPPEDFPLTTSVAHQLPHVAGEEQFELGLAALADGLLREPRHSPGPT
jgi:AcrR family transcriptional regulator